MDNTIYSDLTKRIGKKHLEERLRRQMFLKKKFYSKTSPSPFYLKHITWLNHTLKLLLKITGLYKKGLQNTINYKVEQIKVPIKHLPLPFDGFKILQLSDIHGNRLPDGGKTLRRILQDISADIDICVFTGDFVLTPRDIHKRVLAVTKKISRSLGDHCPQFGILGNHDAIEFVSDLESAGIHMLLNEAVPIRKNGEEIWLSGIDDAHLYHCHDIAKALAKIPRDAVTILLSHTPETYAQANDAGVDYLLCGHTHGGQICLPGGIPIMTNARCPRAFCKGFWIHGDMLGYTARGTGSSGVSARFFCPPEITVHELVCAGTESPSI